MSGGLGKNFVLLAWIAANPSTTLMATLCTCLCRFTLALVPFWPRLRRVPFSLAQQTSKATPPWDFIRSSLKSAGSSGSNTSARGASLPSPHGVGVGALGRALQRQRLDPCADNGRPRSRLELVICRGNSLERRPHSVEHVQRLISFQGHICVMHCQSASCSKPTGPGGIATITLQPSDFCIPSGHRLTVVI